MIRDEGSLLTNADSNHRSPVIFINRELGTSKMNSSIFGEAIFGVIKLKINSWFHKFPQKK
mgnify:CR=1 FL=1